MPTIADFTVVSDTGFVLPDPASGSSDGSAAIADIVVHFQATIS